MTPKEENYRRCHACEHCFVAHDYKLTCELTHKTVGYNDGAVCKHFKKEEEDE